ncbi:MAG: hypothetical protein MI919_38710, partial [Holophagales bacterium]|nr:hypothetical protein [Holophagales bacterium]
MPRAREPESEIDPWLDAELHGDPEGLPWPPTRTETLEEWKTMLPEITCDIQKDWETNPRWAGLERPYGSEQVKRLRGSVRISHTLAELGAQRLWKLLRARDYVNALGALTGNQA